MHRINEQGGVAFNRALRRAQVLPFFERLSNHSRRHFEAGLAVIEQLPKIREAVGPDVPLIYDSSVALRQDVMRALTKGADYVMVGRAFQYAVAALGARGIDHLIHILKFDITANMCQLGIEDITQLSDYLLKSD